MDAEMEALPAQLRQSLKMPRSLQDVLHSLATQGGLDMLEYSNCTKPTRIADQVDFEMLEYSVGFPWLPFDLHAFQAAKLLCTMAFLVLRLLRSWAGPHGPQRRL